MAPTESTNPDFSPSSEAFGSCDCFEIDFSACLEHFDLMFPRRRSSPLIDDVLYSLRPPEVSESLEWEVVVHCVLPLDASLIPLDVGPRVELKGKFLQFLGFPESSE